MINTPLKHEYHTLYQDTPYKLFLTNKAKKRIQELILHDTNMIGLRIDIKKSGCAGFSYVFKKVVKQNYDNNSDIIFIYENKIKIFIAENIASFIHESELDYTEDNLNHVFKFKNPNVQNLCGCGESFNIQNKK